MIVRKILDQKGSNVFSITPDATLSEAVGRLVAHRVGALLVSQDGHRPDGIVSERDIVLAVEQHGDKALSLPVRDVMSADVVCCRLDDTLDALMATMTDRRLRHLPVLRDGLVVGMVSIGDIVKNRLAEVEHEANMLRDYITH